MSINFTRALVRRPSPKYPSFYAAKGITIASSLLAQQHDAYIAALKEAGVKVDIVPGHPRHHDCIFIEDTAIVWQDRALLAAMNDLRQGEQDDVEPWLAKDLQVLYPPRDAKFEGGDVLHLDDVTLVGRSKRTNDAGIKALTEFMKRGGHEVIAVDVTRCLHLKSAMTYLGEGVVLVAPEWIDVNLPRGYTRLDVPPGESAAANVLRVNQMLLHPAGAPKTAALLSQFAGKNKVKLRELPISEAQKGDGALTCQSLLW